MSKQTLFKKSQISKQKTSTLIQTILSPLKRIELIARLKEKFVQLAANSTSHGYPNLFRTNSWLVRLTWSILLIVFMTLCILMIKGLIQDYKQYDVVTETRDYPEAPILFPTLTICNVNPFTSHNASIYIENHKTSRLNSLDDLFKANDRALYTAMGLSDEQKIKFGYKIEDILIFCKFNGKKCSANDFKWYYMYDYGNCYQFNSLNSLGEDNLTKTYKPGSKNGLYLELYASESEYMNSVKPEIGLIVFINHFDVRPGSNGGISLTPGTLSNIAVRKQIKQMSASPFSTCVELSTADFNRTLYDVLNRDGYRYRQNDCFDLCLQTMIIEHCGCFSLEYAKLNNANRSCMTHSDMSCMENMYLKFVDQNLVDLCQVYCPLECDSVEYPVFLSSNSFPCGKYTELLMNNSVFIKHLALKGYKLSNLTSADSHSLAKQSLLALNVYFDDLKYTLISESPKTSIFDLIANIGSALGLFIGISLLSFFEILEYMMELGLICFESFKENKFSISNK